MYVIKNCWGFFVVLLLSICAIAPFSIPGFFPMHDDTQVVRVYEMSRALSDGHFPVRWVKDLGYGYGYPLFNFYAPLPYYVGALLSMVDFNALISTRIMMAIGVLLAGVFMYLFSRKFWGETGGIVAGLFYMYAPYHAVEVYVRGAVGEFWAYAFLPLLSLGLLTRNVVVGAIGFAGVILSHNLTAFMLTPFLLIALLLQFLISKNVTSSKYQVLSVLLGAGLSAFYWLPALFELGYTNVQSQIGGGADFRDHFICWQQLWQSPWGFGGSAAGCMDGLSFKLGKLHILASFAALIFAVLRWRKEQLGIVFTAVGFLLLGIFLMLEISKPLWEAISPMAFLQYPWRFLVFASFFSAFLAGAFIWFVSRSPKVSLGIAAILLSVLFYTNVGLFEPKTIDAKAVEDFISNYHTKWVTSRISDEYMPKDFKKPTSEKEVIERRVSVGEITVDKTQELVFVVNEPETKQVTIAIAPFPAWHVSMDGKRISYIDSNKGIVLAVPSGLHTIRIAFASTPVETIANSISIVSIFMLVGGILVFSKKHGKS